MKNVWTQSLKKIHWTLSWLCWPSRDPLLILQKFFKQTHRDSDCPYMRSYLGLTLYILYHVWKLTKNKKKLSEDLGEYFDEEAKVQIELIDWWSRRIVVDFQPVLYRSISGNCQICICASHLLHILAGNFVQVELFVTFYLIHLI